MGWRILQDWKSEKTQAGPGGSNRTHSERHPRIPGWFTRNFFLKFSPSKIFKLVLAKQTTHKTPNNRGILFRDWPDLGNWSGELECHWVPRLKFIPALWRKGPRESYILNCLKGRGYTPLYTCTPCSHCISLFGLALLGAAVLPGYWLRLVKIWGSSQQKCWGCLVLCGTSTARRRCHSCRNVWAISPNSLHVRNAGRWLQPT